jgi:hypothetical protein
MAKLTCKKPFDITTQKVNGVLTDIVAEVGDVIEVNVRNSQEYYVIAVYKPTGKIKIFSTWKRQNWIKSHCN